MTLRRYMADGGNGFFMFDPFIDVGLAPLMADYGVHLDETMVIDPGHHFAADPSSPAVTDYNFHQITRELPLTFFPVCDRCRRRYASPAHRSHQ
ncbi:MAG: hypothetical protein VCC99_02980 [Alphaproteobacteria bacterium]